MKARPVSSVRRRLLPGWASTCDRRHFRRGSRARRRGRRVAGAREEGSRWGGCAVQYAPDGATFATGAADGAIVLWDGDTGTLLHRLSGPPTGGGPKLPPRRTHRADHLVRWRPLHMGHPARELDPGHVHQAGRNLTQDEWNDAFDNRPYRETCPKATEGYRTATAVLSNRTMVRVGGRLAP